MLNVLFQAVEFKSSLVDSFFFNFYSSVNKGYSSSLTIYLYAYRFSLKILIPNNIHINNNIPPITKNDIIEANFIFNAIGTKPTNLSTYIII